MCVFRSDVSWRSRACRARARARWFATSCCRRSCKRSTSRSKQPAGIRRCWASSCSTRSSTWTSRPLAVPRARTQPPTRVCSTTSASCSPPRKSQRCVATCRAASVSTWPVAAARRAAAMAPSRSRCTFFPTSTCRARSARALATTATRSTFSSRARTSPRCSICRWPRPSTSSPTNQPSRATCRRWSMWGSATCAWVSLPPRCRVAKRSA